MNKLPFYILYDILKNRIVIAYTVFLFLITIGLFQIEENNGKAILSLLTIVLLFVPLICMIFTTIHYYNSYEFLEMMLSQPISRTRLLLSEFIGVTLALLIAFLIGVGVPVLFYTQNSVGLALVLAGMALTLVFISIAFLASIKTRDKARGIGVTLLLWFYFSLLFDGFILLILFTFGDYPLEKITIVLSSLNPVDLARVSIMLQLDISAVMGYTGALYKAFYGSSTGIIVSTLIMVIWITTPLLFAVRSFKRKDL
jgi:Cu-processing system permease protein